MADASAGKIPTWAMVLGTGIGLVFYAQREFIPRSEQNLVAKANEAQYEALSKRDDELAQNMKALVATIEKSNTDLRAAIETHAKAPSHGGTADQLNALHSYLYATSTANVNYQRTVYTILQQIAAKERIVVPPLPESPVLPAPGTGAPTR